MASQSRLDELVLRWQELWQKGCPASAAELCADCPDLLESLQREIQGLMSMEAFLFLTTGAGESPAPIPGAARVSPSRAEAAGRPPAPVVEASGGVAIPGYEILAVLGRGGMGVVYLARQAKLKRSVALKMLRGELTGAEARARLRREAEALARLQHPNIVQVYDLVEHAGRHGIALEYVPGCSLAEKLGGKPLPPGEAARLVATLARAAHAAHQAGIVHRDLKPANVLLTPSGVPKITDFGVAQCQDWSRLTAEGRTVGTLAYMSPEQAVGKTLAIGPATDTYALGAILYECLTGQAPFGGPFLNETLRQILHEEPVPPTRWIPQVPRWLEAVCLRCLRKEPGQRPDSAESLGNELTRGLAEAVAGETASAHRIGIEVYCELRRVYGGVLNGSVEVGRQRGSREEVYTAQPRRGRTRLVLGQPHETWMSRAHVLIEALPGGRVKISNLSTNGNVLLFLRGGTELAGGRSCNESLPTLLTLGTKTIRLRSPAADEPGTGAAADVPPPALRGDAARDILDRLQPITRVLRPHALLSTLFTEAARAVVELVALDRGLVLLLESGKWRSVASWSAPQCPEPREWRPAEGLMAALLAEKRTVCRTRPASADEAKASTAELLAEITAPILDSSGGVVGVLHGGRRADRAAESWPELVEIEALMMEILARGVALGLARLE